jgi:eukaryotic-like serine/threonine-protein kinase
MADPVEPPRTVIQPRPVGSETAGAEAAEGPEGTQSGEGASFVDAAHDAPPEDEPARHDEQIVTGEEHIVASGSRPPSAPDGASAETPQIAIGAVLNHIYRVDRFIARGGMGEVYEGTNVTNPEDRVAIKIILPHLAADPKILALFRSEARTLTKLSHPGLVQYRLLAQEPQLNVLYIVMAFIDGPELSEVLPSLNASPEDLLRFIRRLASALATAHMLGKVHRDISPDNILLPNGVLDEAKIIDFGIAKDLAAAKGTKTIVGSGFAGKLGYVAPEQFGDTRDVGPWTDVYSLGLVALAVALRRAPDMGATFAEALEARRVVPDLSAAPQLLRPVLARMLEPDRTKRFQSMDEVVVAVDAIPRLQLHRTLRPGVAPRPSSSAPTETPAPRQPRVLLAALSGLVLAAVLTAIVIEFLPPSPSSVAPALKYRPTARAVPAVSITNDVDKVRTFVAASLPRIGCSWLEMQDPVATPRGVLLKLSGVAADPANLFSDLARRTGVKSIVDLSDVSPVQSSACGLLDVARGFRAPASRSHEGLHVLQAQYHVMPNPEGCPHSPSAKIVTDWKAPDPAADFYLADVESSGRLGVIYRDRADYLRASALRSPEVRANGSFYQADFCVDDEMAQRSPISGVLLIVGRGPFDLGSNPLAESVAAGRDWLARFTRQAKRRGWTTQMAWFKIELPETLSGTPNVVDTATLMINGYRVRLAGIEGLAGRYAEDFRVYIRLHGNTVTCERDGEGSYYDCVIPSNKFDVSKLVLANGKARAIATATESQKKNEEYAKSNRLGIWANAKH